MSDPLTNVTLAANDMAREIDRLTRERDGYKDHLAFLERTTLPDLYRQIQHHQAGKQRWQERAEKAEPERDTLQQRLHDAAMVKVWTNEDRKKFVFLDDIAPALLGLKPKDGDPR